jgi:PAS domain S-box-containing protein
MFRLRTALMNKKSMRRNVVTFIACCCFVAIGATTTPGSAQQTVRPQTVRIVMDNNYPPYVFYDGSGNLQGILIDQWRLWEQKTGVRADIIAVDWDDALRRMEKGEFEVIDTIFLNKRRVRLYDFSKPYADIDASIFFHKNISGIVDVDSIKGFAVAVKSGDAAVDFLKTHGVTQLLEFSSYESIIRAVQEKKITVFVMDKPPALYFLYKVGLQEEFRFSEPLYKGQFHRAVKKGSAKTLNLVEEGFSRISADEYEAINRKWFGSHFSFPAYLTYLAYAAVMLAFVGLVLGIWNYTLRKKVQEKTGEVRESERRLADIIDFLPDATLVIDRHGRVIAWNRAIETMTGVKAEEMLGKDNFEYAIPFYNERRPILIDLALKPDEACERKYVDVRKNDHVLIGEAYMPALRGGEVYLLGTASILRDSKGNVIGAIESIHDLTGRRQAEEALRDSRERYRGIFENAVEGIFQSAPEGHFIRVNPAMARMCGYESPEDLICHITDIATQIYVYPEERRIFIEQLTEKGFINNFEHLARRKGGGQFWVSVNARAVRDGSGKLLYYEGTHEDINERKRAEKELRAKTALLEAQVNASPDGIMVIDENQKRILFNLRIVDLFNAPQHIMDNEDDAPLLRHVASQIRDPEKFFEKVMFLYDQPNESGRDEIEFRNGMILERYSAPVLGNDGQNYGRIWTFRDITDRRRAEEERRQLEERLQRSEKMEALGALAGGVAHDLNNVLGILVGYSELLLDEIDESSALRPHVEYIQQGGQRAAAIVQDLLTLARRGVKTRKIVNLNASVTDLQKRPEFEKLCSYHSNVRIMANLAPDLLNIMGSPVHLEKTIMNLVSNAAEAMSKGGQVSIITTNQYLDRPVPGYEEVREGDYVVLRVTDTGEGISVNDIKRIFEPFYTKKVMGRSGTGLGLAVVWGTVKDHNGYINVQSEPGEGTTFTLYFPVTRGEVPEDQPSISPSEYMGKGETILVVDDAQGQRELAERILTKLNYVVATASSGEEAVEYLKTNTVGLLVLDMIMDPGIDGLETYRRIKEIHPRQKAVIVSGFSESDQVSRAQEMGAGAYIRKPYIQERLGIAVRDELDRSA